MFRQPRAPLRCRLLAGKPQALDPVTSPPTTPSQHLNTPPPHTQRARQPLPHLCVAACCALHCCCCEAVECCDVAHHLHALVEGAVAVILGEAVLLQVVVLDEPGGPFGGGDPKADS
jgi:hypothetical protein